MRPDFDKAPVRTGTGSYKWDSRPGTIPLWVADMDFATAPCITEALRRRVEHGVFGYTLPGPDYYGALRSWFAGRHGYEIDTEAVIYTSGVVPALSAIIKALVRPGEGVVVQTPVYNCFFSSIRNNGCAVVENPLLRRDCADGTFTYAMDTDGLEEICGRPDVKMLLLCNPANPAGRLWTRAELEEVARITRATGVTVVSDEIHCELTAPGTQYVPYGTVDPGGVICLSPSKAFNTAGLQIANIVCPSHEVRAAIDRAININEVCDVNPFGIEGLKAAYTPEGAAWLDALRVYLWDNCRYAVGELRRRLPSCPVCRLEATYLLWVDISTLGMDAETLEELLLDKAGVWVNAGTMYGTDGFIRLNLACPRALLAEGLDRMLQILPGL